MRQNRQNRQNRQKRSAVVSPQVPLEASGASPGAEVTFDPFAPGYFADPYPQYAELRDHHPAYFEARSDAYILTRYQDVHRLARDKSMLVELDHAIPTPRIMAERVRNSAVAAGPDKWMVFRDGDDHARLRCLLSQVFTPNAVAVWRERTEAIVEQLL